MLSVILVLVFCISFVSLEDFSFNASAAVYGENNLIWTFDETTGLFEISGSGEMDDVVATINLPWYSNLNKIKSIVIGEGITRIGSENFVGCKNLSDISLPMSLKSIGGAAFYDCDDLQVINIPDNVVKIESMAFAECNQLDTVNLPDSLKIIEEGAFAGCCNLKNITLPPLVENIGENAFDKNDTLFLCHRDSYAHRYCIDNNMPFEIVDFTALYKPLTFERYNGHTYALYDNVVTWTEAKLICEVLGGHLAVVTSKDEQDAINTIISEANDTTKNGYWLGASDSSTEGTFEWITGEPFSDYSYWGSGEPTNGNGGTEHYLEVYLKTNKWNDAKIDATNRGFICEFEDYAIPVKTLITDTSIYSVYDDNMSAPEAKTFCEKIGGHLVYISDETENDLVTELIVNNRNSHYWIGITDKENDGIWKTFDGNVIEYSNWAADEPNGKEKQWFAQITAVNYSSHVPGVWTDNLDVYTGTNAFYKDSNTGFVCEVDLGEISVGRKQYYGFDLYELYRTELSWEDANTFAESKGGHLLVISNEEEWQFVSRLISGFDNDFWLGGTREKTISGLTWINDEEFDCDDWMDLIIDNSNRTDLYLKMNGDGVVSDVPNNGENGIGALFIIEYFNHKKTRNVSFDCCGGDSIIDQKTVVYGEKYGSLPTPNKAGYRFEGWYTEAGKQITYSMIVDLFEHITLYAHWKPELYNVSFDLNGGAGLEEAYSKCVTYDSTYGTLPEPTKEGYIFVGWSLEDGTHIDSLAKVETASDHTLTAVWSERSVTTCQIHTLPDKTDYVLGEKLNSSGLTLLVGYDNGEQEIIEDGFIVPDVEFTSCENNIIDVFYGDFVTSFSVNVTRGKPIKIAIKTLPDKTEYLVGDKMDTTGLILEATYLDGSTEWISSGYTVSVTTLNRVGKQIVTVSFENCTATFIVSILENLPTYVSVEKLPDKLIYYVGEKVDTTGLQLRVKYKNSEYKIMSSGYSVCDGSAFDNNFAFTQVGEQYVFVEYTENGESLIAYYTVTVVEEPEGVNIIYTDDNYYVSADDLLEIPIRIKNNQGFMGFSVCLEYNSSVFTPITVVGGSVLSSGALNDNIDSAANKLKFVYTGSQNVADDGELFVVYFLVEENYSGEYEFDVSYIQIDTFDENWQDVAFDCKDFKVTVANHSEKEKVEIFSEEISADSDSNVLVPVFVNNADSVETLSLKFSYNSTLFEYVGLKKAENADSLPQITTTNSDELVLTWSNGAKISDGLIVYVEFYISKYVNGTHSVDINCENITFENNEEKELNVFDCLLTVTNAYRNQSSFVGNDDTIRVTAGSVIEVPVYISNNHGLMGFGISIKYNPNVFSTIKVTRGSTFNVGLFDSYINEDDGIIKIIWNHSEEIEADGCMFVLHLLAKEVVEDTTGLLTIEHSSADTFDEYFQDALIECNDIEYSVVAITEVFEPVGSTVFSTYGDHTYIYGLQSALTTDVFEDNYILYENVLLEYNIITPSKLGTGSTVTVKSEKTGQTKSIYTILIFGDVNGDGWYDGQDAVLVSCLANGMLTKEDVGEAVYTAADCNHDGVIDEADVALLNEAGTLLANVDQTTPSEVLLEASSEYVEYLDLIDQSPEFEVEDDTETDVEHDAPESEEEETPEADTEDSTQQDAKVDIWKMILNFIKSVFEMLLAHIPVPLK